MTRIHIAALIVLVVAIPAATAGSFFASNDKALLHRRRHRLSDLG